MERTVFEPDDICSLSDFQRNAKSLSRRLKKTGRAQLLTVNGRAAVVIQDAEAYKKMIEHYERQNLIEAVRVGIEQMEAGKGVPFDVAMKRIRAKYGLNRRSRRTA